MKKPTAVEQGNRMRAANEALKAFAGDTWLTFGHGHIVVSWRDSRGLNERRWMTRGQSFYPVWYDRWCHGGTACTALALLVRWIQGKPVYGIGSWRWWASERVKLIRDMTAIDRLVAAGYPEKHLCVLCGIEPTSLDWWSLDGVSGPCCGWTTGCRQKPTSSVQRTEPVSAAS